MKEITAESSKERIIRLDVLLAELIEAKTIEYTKRLTTPEELSALAVVVNAYHSLMLDC